MNMPVTQKCSFCGQAIATGTGKLFIRKDAKMIWLCGNKCEKNMNKLSRKARETGWTEDYRLEKKARMAAVAHSEQTEPSADKKPVKKASKKAK
jgi:ribosomal protein L24E